MKKFWSLFALVMMTVAAVTISSCTKDDDDNDDPLEGEWYGEYSMIEGSTAMYGNVSLEAEDGEGEMYGYIRDSYGHSESVSADFTYTYDDETITMKVKGGEKLVYEYELKEKKGETTLYLYRKKGGVEEAFILEKEEDDDDDDDYYSYSYSYPSTPGIPY